MPMFFSNVLFSQLVPPRDHRWCRESTGKSHTNANWSYKRIRPYFPASYKVLKCRDYSGEYRLEQNISREKGCGDDIAAKCLQFIKTLYGWDDRRSRCRNFCVMGTYQLTQNVSADTSPWHTPYHTALMNDLTILAAINSPFAYYILT